MCWKADGSETCRFAKPWPRRKPGRGSIPRPSASHRYLHPHQRHHLFVSGPRFVHVAVPALFLIERPAEDHRFKQNRRSLPEEIVIDSKKDRGDAHVADLGTTDDPSPGLFEPARPLQHVGFFDWNVVLVQNVQVHRYRSSYGAPQCPQGLMYSPQRDIRREMPSRYSTFGHGSPQRPQ